MNLTHKLSFKKGANQEMYCKSQTPCSERGTFTARVTLTIDSKTTLRNRIGWLRSAFTLKPSVTTVHPDIEINMSVPNKQIGCK